MRNLKYVALLPIAGEAGYGSYLMVSNQEAENSTPWEVPNAGAPTNPNGEPVLEDAPDKPKEDAKEPVAPVEKPQSSNNAPSEPVDLPEGEQEETDTPGEMIERAGDGSVGHQYKQYLIGSKDSPHWNKKIET